MPVARIVITLFNSDADIDKCLEALSLQTRSDFEVVLVNNNPQNMNLDRYQYPKLALSLINSPKNSGFSGGSNLGAKGAKTGWIITLNPDAWPRPDWFEVLMQAAHDNPDYAMLSSTLLNAENPKIIDGLGDAYSIFGIGWRGAQGRFLDNIKPKNLEVLSPCGAAAAYRRCEFENIGGFDESYFCYLEDLNLAIRHQMLGYKCLHVFKAYVLHRGAGSTEERSRTQLYHSSKNQIKLIVNLAPWPFLFLMLLLSGVSQIWVLSRTRKQKNWINHVQGIKRGIVSIPSYMAERRSSMNNQVAGCTTQKFSRMIYWSPRSIRSKDHTCFTDSRDGVG